MFLTILKRFLFFLIALDLILINYQLLRISTEPTVVSVPTAAPSPLPSPVPTAPLPVESPLPSSQPSPSFPQSISKTKTVSYLPIPGTGQTSANSWLDIPGTEFYFSTQDYPHLIESYFEANFKLQNGNGQAFVRLFDITAGIEVWSSDLVTTGQQFTAVTSDKLTLRSGNHLYRVQAKSLTADTVIYNSGRLKIVSEN